MTRCINNKKRAKKKLGLSHLQTNTALCFKGQVKFHRQRKVRTCQDMSKKSELLKPNIEL